MRRGHGSTKVPNVKLRPPPVSSTIRRSPNVDADVDMDEDEEHPTVTHPDLSLSSRPFSKVILCSTGIKDKAALFKQATALGARCQNDLTSDITHLIASETKGAKYDCAVENGMAVMSSEWISRCYAAWIEGQDIDFESSVEQFRLPFLRGSSISVTGDIDVPSRKEISRLVELYGGVYSSNLTKACTHLLVCGASYDVVRSTEKVKFALRVNREGKSCVSILWVEWFWDCVTSLGKLPEEKYAIEQPRPALRASGSSIGIVASATNPSESSQPASDGAAEIGCFRASPQRISVDTTNDDPEPALVQMRSQVAIGAQKALLWKYIKGKNLIESDKASHDSPANIPDDLDRTERAAASLPILADQGPQWTHTTSDKGPSVISRLAMSRNTSAPSSGFASHSNPLTFGGGLEGSQDHVDVVPASQKKRGVFDGKTFCLVGDAKGPVLEGAIVSSGGTLLPETSLGSQDNVDIGLVDWFIVRLSTGSRCVPESGSPLHHLVPKYLTECWVEECLHQERLCLADEHASFRPIIFDTPLPGLQGVRVHISGLEDGDLLYTQRLIRTLGAQVAVVFSRRSTTHLVCTSCSGTKYEHAVRWNMPVVKPAWMYDMAKAGHVLDVANYSLNDAQEFSVSSSRDHDARARLPPLSEIPHLGALSAPSACTVTATALSADVCRAPGSAARSGAPHASKPQQTTPTKGKTSFSRKGSSGSPLKLPSNQAASDALNDLAALLGTKRNPEEHEEHASGRKKKRRPVARVKSSEHSSGASSSGAGNYTPVQVFDIPGRLADGVEHEPLTRTEMIASAEESMRVMYEDPEQRAEKRKLMKMIGAIPESLEGSELDVAASATVQSKTRTGLKRSTRHS